MGSCPRIQSDLEGKKNIFKIYLIGTIMVISLFLYCMINAPDWMIAVVGALFVVFLGLLTYDKWTDIKTIETLIFLTQKPIV